jgi:hypothetical protein
VFCSLLGPGFRSDWFLASSTGSCGRYFFSLVFFARCWSGLPSPAVSVRNLQLQQSQAASSVFASSYFHRRTPWLSNLLPAGVCALIPFE